MLLVNPATYVATADFKTMPLDYDLSSYTDPNITDLLVRASGMANAIMNTSLLARELNVTFYGDDTNVLDLRARPLLYIRKLQFFQPGGNGYIVPLGSVRVDAVRGQVVQYSPIAMQGVGLYDYFPEGWPIQAVFGTGYGYNPITAPTWAFADAAPGTTNAFSLTAGSTYQVGVTTRTQFGETEPAYQPVTTATGAIMITIAPQLGADTFRVFLGATAQTAKLVGEVSAVAANAGAPLTIGISSSAPPFSMFSENAPTTDTSALSLPQEIREAVRLLAMQIIYEQNNLANRGVAGTSSGRKRTQWRSTEGSSGRGVPLFYDQAVELLAGFKLQEIF